MHRYKATVLLAAGAVALGLITAHPGAAEAAGSVSIQQSAVISNPVIQGSNFGYNVALNAKGTVMAVASPFFDYLLGRVNIYRKDGAGWKHTASFTPPGTAKPSPAHPGFTYGHSLTLNAAGTELAVGGGPVGGPGAVYTYKQEGSAWKLSSTLNGTAAGGVFGYDVALTSDGSKLAVLTFASSSSVTTYHAAATGWVQDGTVTCSNSRCSDIFANSGLAISGSGNTLAVQSFGAAAGQAGVFTRKNGKWTLATSLPNGYPGGIAMNAAGNEVVAASVETPVGGTQKVVIRAYQQTSTGWQHTATLKAPCVRSGAGATLTCGSAADSVSLNTAGTEIAFSDIQATVHGVKEGQVYLYGLASGKFTAQGVVSGPTSERDFGWSVALDANADILVVGEPLAYDTRGEVLTYSIPR